MTLRQTPSAKRPDNQVVLRLISGLVMAVAALALVWAGPWPFAFLVIGAAAIALWEWDRLTAERISPLFLGLRIALIVAACYFALEAQPTIALLTILVGALFATALPGDLPRRLWAGAGVAYLGLPAIALIWLRLDSTHGFAAVLFVFLVVWSSDSGAYCVGRRLGGPRLTPRLSPGKTWSGALGGLVASALAAAFVALWLGGTSVLVMTLIGLVLSIVAQIGDLTESAIKRRFGLKDSSHLIPGHGGLLDRVDALLFAVLAAALLALAKSVNQPGQALLIWT